MRLIKATLALALFIAIAAANANAASYQAGAKLFGYQVVPPGIGFSVENFTCENKTTYVILSYDEPAAFFSLNDTQGAAFPGIRPIVDTATISDYLHCYYVKTGHASNITDSFSKIHAEIAKLEDDDDRGEAGCRILLGTDRTKCVSFETCQRACYSVTSFCQPVALGVGRTFVNEIWTFENNSRALDEAYSKEEMAYAAFSENASKEMALDYLGTINETYAIAEQASVSPLFYDYSFCFSPDYPVYDMYVLKMRTERQYQNSSVFYSIPVRSQEIANRTVTAMEKKTKYRLPVIEETATVQAGGARRNGTYSYSDDEEQTQTTSFIANFFKGIAEFFLGWAQRK